MVQKVYNNSINNIMLNSVPKEEKKVEKVTKIDDSLQKDVPSFGTYIKGYVSDNSDRFINGICHIKLDGSDVVLYKEKFNGRFLTSIHASVTVNEELVRIPKKEVLKLLEDLYTQHSDEEKD